MPTSVRFAPDLEARLRAMADAEGVPLSEVLRRAAQRYVGGTDSSLQVHLADAIGTVKSRGGRARRTGKAFRRLVRRRS